MFLQFQLFFCFFLLLLLLQQPLNPEWPVHQKKILYILALIILWKGVPELLWTQLCHMTLVLTSVQLPILIQSARSSRLTVTLV